jgi:adenylate cyclase
MAAMATDFEGEGLLDDLEQSEREARLQLLQELEAEGVPVEELRSAVEEDRLAILPVERALEGEERYTGPQLAEIVGLELDFLVKNREALGLPVSDPSARVFTDEDVKAGQMSKLFIDGGLPEEGILEVSRVIGMGMARIAEASRILFAETLIQPGDTELEVGRRFAAAAPHMRELTGPILQYAFNLHLLELVRRDVLGRGDLSAGQLPQADIAVCFADMVGFTKLGERLETEQLGGLGRRLGELAAAISRPPVRVVKLIGDAVMLVSPEPKPLLETALGLVEAAENEGEGFPQLRAGVAQGAAVGRGGDWYGRPINLASRVTGLARPGSVLATEGVREAIGDGYRYSYAGARRLKGIQGEVKLFRVRPEEG